VRVTDVKSDKTVRNINHNHDVISVAFSPDGKKLATATLCSFEVLPDGFRNTTVSGEVRLTDLKSGKTIQTITFDNNKLNRLSG